MSCAYRDIFGAPNTGVHAYRIAGLAAFDVIATVIVGIVIAKLTGYRIVTVLLWLFILGIVLHRLFCVRTTVDRLLFPNLD